MIAVAVPARRNGTAAGHATFRAPFASGRQASQTTVPKSVALFAMSLLVLATAAFWPQYLTKSRSAIDAYTHAHAALGAAWLLCLAVQPVFILRGHRVAHRLLGQASLVIAPAFVVSSVLLAHFRFSRMSAELFAQEAFALYLPLAVALLFGLAYALGVRWRRVAAVHARFMASTGLLLLDPVLARVMFFYLPPLPLLQLYQAITFTLIAGALAFMLRTLPAVARGRHWFRNYCAGAAVVLALFFAVPHTSAWLAFARWFRNLPLT